MIAARLSAIPAPLRVADIIRADIILPVPRASTLGRRRKSSRCRRAPPAWRRNQAKRRSRVKRRSRMGKSKVFLNRQLPPIWKWCRGAATLPTPSNRFGDCQRRSGAVPCAIFREKLLPSACSTDALEGPAVWPTTAGPFFSFRPGARSGETKRRSRSDRSAGSPTGRRQNPPCPE